MYRYLFRTQPQRLERGTVTNNNGNGKGQKGSLENLSEQAYEIAKRRQAAANEAVVMLEDHYETAFASRAAALLQAAAWLAGNSLRRSFESGDGASPDDNAAENDESQEQRKLMKAFLFLVDRYGIKLKANDYATEIPPEQKVHLSAEEIEGIFVGRYDEIMQRHGFDYADGARTGAVVCARLVKLHCANRNDLEPQVAASIVTAGFVEGGKRTGT